MQTLQQILGFENLTGIINDPAGGVPSNLIPPAFMASTKDVMGNTASWTIIRSTRRNMRLTNYGAASTRIAQQEIGRATAVMAHFFEHQRHDMQVLNAVRQFDNPQVQQMGRQIIDQQTAEFRRRADNTRLSLIYSLLAEGRISFDGDGNILPDTTGQVVDVDFQIPAGHRDQLDVEGTGDIISASWAAATTDIVGQIRKLHDVALRTSGLPLAHAFYGEDILGFLLANNQVTNFLRTRESTAAAMETGTIPDGFLGIKKWWTVSAAFFEDQNGVNKTWFEKDQITFTPEVNPMWYQLQQGSFMVPTNLGGVGPDASAMLNNFRTMFGRFSYAKVTDDPAGIKHSAGDTVLPVLRNPTSIFLADVVP